MSNLHKKNITFGGMFNFQIYRKKLSNSHPDLNAIFALSCCLIHTCWCELRYNLGYKLAKTFSHPIILPPSPNFHALILSTHLSSLSSPHILFKSLQQKDDFFSTLLSTSPLPPYLDSLTWPHKEWLLWKKVHFHLTNKVLLKNPVTFSFRINYTHI